MHNVDTIIHSVLYPCWWITCGISYCNSLASNDVSSVYSSTSLQFIKACSIFCCKRQAVLLSGRMTEGDDDTLTPEFSPHPHPFIRWECSGLMGLFKPATAVKTSSTNALMPGVNLKASLYHYMTPLLNESGLIRAPVRLKRSN